MRSVLLLWLLVVLTSGCDLLGGGSDVTLDSTGTFVVAWTAPGGAVTTMESADGRRWFHRTVHQTSANATEGPAIASDGDRTFLLMWKNGPELQYVVGLGGLDPADPASSSILWESSPTVGVLSVQPAGSPAVAGDAQQWLAVYRNGADELMAVRTRSGTAGIAWESPVAVVPGGSGGRVLTTSRDPALAWGDDGYVLVVRVGSDVQALTSPDGVSWSTPAAIDTSEKDPPVTYRDGAYYTATSHAGVLGRQDITVFRSDDATSWAPLGEVTATALNATGPALAFGKSTMLLTEAIGGALGGGASRVVTRRGIADHPASDPAGFWFADDEDILDPGGNTIVPSSSGARTALTFAQSHPNRIPRDPGFTQAGIFGPAVPWTAPVAGKSSMLLVTLTAPADEVWLDVVDQDTQQRVVAIEGFAFDTDNVSHKPTLEAGDDVHFFVAGSLIEDGATLRFDLTLTEGGDTITYRGAIEDQTFFANGGVPLSTVSFDTAPPSTGTINTELVEMARLYPVADEVGPLGSQTAGIRSRHTPGVPLPVQGSIGDVDQEFVMVDLVISTGQGCTPGAATTTLPGRSLAFNFSVPEELNGMPGFQGVDLDICTTGQRYANLVGALNASAQSAGQAAANAVPSDPPRFSLAVVDNVQNRTGLLGQCPQGLANGRLCWNTVGMFTPAVPHEVGHAFGLCHSDDTNCERQVTPDPSSFGYDMLRQIRKPNPASLMNGGIAQGFDNNYLYPEDFEYVKAQIESPAYAALGAP